MGIARLAKETLPAAVAYVSRLRRAPWSSDATLPARSRVSSASGMRLMSTPSTMTWPAEARWSPPKSPSSVDLPEPDGPSSATCSPGAMSRFTPRSATTSWPATVV